ncbi:hypothetical protein H9P43_000854 [Blastocladiella emersonii ATCC 22665]|nr:hypothetical protein H9P43_000854 [Blastocladiella emersonii ATCC 22665]
MPVFVEVNGTKAEEYKVETTTRDDGVLETRCAIESIAGAPFGAHVSNVGHVYRNVCAVLYVDGKSTLITNNFLNSTPNIMNDAIQMYKQKLMHVFIFDYMSRDMLEVRKYIATPDITSTALAASTPTSPPPKVKPERGATQVIDLSGGDGDSAVSKRRRPNEGPVRPTPVVYLDDSDDEETSRAPRKLPVKSEPSSTANSTVISLLSDDDE